MHSLGEVVLLLTCFRQVASLWQNYESSPELIELGDLTKNTVKDWKDTLLEFRLKFEKKYGTSLSPKGSGNWVKDTSKKVLWLTEKEDVLKMKEKLRTVSHTISMLAIAARE